MNYRYYITNFKMTKVIDAFDDIDKLKKIDISIKKETNIPPYVGAYTSLYNKKGNYVWIIAYSSIVNFLNENKDYSTATVEDSIILKKLIDRFNKKQKFNILLDEKNSI